MKKLIWKFRYARHFCKLVGVSWWFAWQSAASAIEMGDDWADWSPETCAEDERDEWAACS